MYNRVFREDHVKIWIAAIAMISLAGLVSADDLEDSYAKLKAAVASKNAEQVKTSAAQTQKLARALVNTPSLRRPIR